MKTIIRIAAEYGPHLASIMTNIASMASSAEELSQHAHNIANQWQSAHASVERAHQPTWPDPRLSYFCWEWDARYNCWRTAQWNGQTWVLI